MISFKIVAAIWLGAVLCTAQTIKISGVVQNATDVGVSGAVVKLENANISATSGEGGKFILTGNVGLIKPYVKSSALASNPIQFQNGMISFTLSENTNVVISIHDVGGRRIYNSKGTYGSGTHAIETPLQSTGISIYKVNIGDEAYSFRSSPFRFFSTESSAVLGGTFTLAKQTKTMTVIADVISVVKEGQLNYRDSIKTSDTTGIIIKMIPNAGDVTDADGNVYQSVRIGSQVWTITNLRSTKYNDGTTIPNVTESGVSGGTTGWRNLTTGAYCYYENNTANMAKYGALYNWYAVNTGKLAPTGWRVPTDAEWTILQNYLIANGYNWDGTTSGNKIAKLMAAKTDWASWTSAGAIGNDLSTNNASGFSALPGGYRNFVGSFYTQSRSGYWWSATEHGASSAYYRGLYSSNESLARSYYTSSGFSVRLLRD